MGIGTAICYRLARGRALRGSRGAAGHNPATHDLDAYVAWRTAQLSEQLAEVVDLDALSGRDVLDFGCGHGDLTFLLAHAPVASLTAVDSSAERVGTARERAKALKLPLEPLILQSEHEHTIALPDASMDAILCFDVLEHLLPWRRIVKEWRRILRPGGRVYIWWVPWWNPWGHHVESLVPIPWAHLFFSERTLVQTCARIYDDERFVPRVWDLEEDGGRKPNKWRSMDRLPELNRLTIRRFERFLPEADLRIASRRVKGFGGSAWSRATRPLVAVPVLGELFVSYAIYELERA